MTIQEIVKQLEAWSEAYYAGNEQVDDATFDALEDELRELDPTSPYFSKNREKPFKYGVKVSHPYEFIGSLEKIHSVQESIILKRAAFVWLSAKLDGASLVTYFRDGKLDKAVTRGNGTVGVDVTQHYLAITKKYSVAIPEDFTGAIRGEVVFKLDNWSKFKSIHPEAKAPRNSGTGLLNQKEVQPEEELLDYVVYDVVATSTNQFDHWGLLSQFNYPLAPSVLLDTTAIGNKTFEVYFKQWSAIYPCDGIVIRDAITKPEKVLQGLFFYEKHQEAYKFQAEIKEATLIDIVWQMGRTGKLTPVGVIEPIELSGATIRNVSFYNVEFVQKYILPADTIAITRSNEVIPKVAFVIINGELVVPNAK